ncbi:MAG: cytochrome c oxidase subunit II transmembrane domain-containing protein [Flavobacteriales bacterium]
MKLLILLVVVLGLVAAVQLSKVYQLSISLRGKREEDISEADNRLNGGAWLAFMVFFYASFIWLMLRYGSYGTPPASEHGLAVDQLMNFNMAIIFVVFFIVNTLLFWFAAKYYYRADRKARFFAHDNRLELVWTIIPSIVLAIIIAYGLKTWNEMTGEASEDALRVELYSKQFDWTARYPGNDGEFGLANYNLITPMNALGIVTEEGIAEAMNEINAKIAEVEEEIMYEKGHLIAEREALMEQLKGDAHHGAHDAHGAHDEHGAHDDSHDEHGNHDGHDHGHNGDEVKAIIEARLSEIEEMLASDKVTILTDAAYEAKEDKLYRLQRHRQRIEEIREFNYDGELSAWEAGMDDQIVKGEFHLPVGREVEFIFRSRDVIHSAYMPQFRAQMNTVPGVPTRFKMTPTVTTDSMRVVLGDPEFDYVLLCNKVCGAAHFNMQMKLVVESQEDYEAWLSEQDEFLVKEEPLQEQSEEGAEQPAVEESIESTNVTASL